jgi:hypothetical protein
MTLIQYIFGIPSLRRTAKEARMNEDREKHGKKPFDGSKPPEKKIINESVTDTESQFVA